MLDLIDEIGPAGEYISHMETARLCRTEIWTPTLMDRDPWLAWEAAGGLTMQDRIHQKLERILQTHRPAPLPDGAAQRFQEILEAAEAREKARPA